MSPRAKSTLPGPNPSGLCMCGCGERTSLASMTSAARGVVAGKPVRYINGHHSRTPGVPSCGYIVREETGCWEWRLKLTPEGYGLAWNGKGMQPAHRMFYERRNGPIPDGLHIDHLCRNRACVNPDHLEAVTPLENARRSARPKLTVAQVAEIKAQPDARSVDLAERYGVSFQTIDSIRRGSTWGDVEAEA